MLTEHDIVALVHTAARPALQPPSISHLHCLSDLARSFDPAAGGVACWVKPWLVPYAKPVRKRSDLGILWIRFDGINIRPLFIAVCYFPPGNSNYYGRSGVPDLAGHYAALHADISEYAGKGDIVLLGDFNARTGSELDVGGGDIEGWQAMEAAGVPVAPGLVAGAAALRALPPRASTDPTVNAAGRLFLELCRACQLIIVNGRTPSDSIGAATYVADHGAMEPGAPDTRPRSLVDYVVATPSLFFNTSGAILPDADLQVGSMEYVTEAMVPSNDPQGRAMRLDHRPVSTCFTVTPRPSVAAAPQGRPAVSFKWEWAAQSYYTDALCTHGLVLSAFHNMALCAGDAEAAAQWFLHGIHGAIDSLSPYGFKLVKRARAASSTAPANSWYNDECRTNRQALRAAHAVHGFDSTEYRDAWRAYRGAVRRAKAAATQRHVEHMIHLWRRSPKKFWGEYKSVGEGAQTLNIDSLSDYFSKLLAGAGVGSYHGGSIEAHCEHHGTCFPPSSREQDVVAAALNENITESEVVTALRAVAGGKAPGVDGLVIEFLKHATVEVEINGRRQKQYVLAPALTTLFNIVLRGQYPAAWGLGALTPVPKAKGDPMVYDNNRGIAVGPALAKLYSIVLMNRMDKWAESNGMRAAGQAGFRHGRCTMDNILVLQHAIDTYRAANKPLFCAFIDFRKAYDCVDRGLLWRCLRSCGLHGDILHSLMGMYDHAQMQIRLHGRLGEPFDTSCGVRQGDPLSPLLFGIFIDRFEQYLRTHKPGLGCMIAANVLLQLLFYADDIVLFAESAADLQELLDALQGFCDANLMSINVPKSEVVVFNSACAGAARAHELTFDWRVNGMALTRATKFVYLGVLFEDGTPMRDAFDRMLIKGKAALFAMLKRCHDMNLHTVKMQTSLFGTLVLPVVSYGCEIWGAYHTSKIGTARMHWGGKGPAECIQLNFLRQCLGVPTSAPVAAMMHETGCSPIMHHWVARMIGFWNGIIQRPDHDIVKIALLDNVRLAEQHYWGRASPKCWAKAFLDGLAAIHRPAYEAASQGGVVGAAEVMEELERRWRAAAWRPLHQVRIPDAAMAGNPSRVRACPDNVRDGFKLLTYDTWIREHDVPFDRTWDGSGSWIYSVDRREHIVAMARFRLGSSWLNIEKQRYGPSHRPRNARLCPHCQAREDELHIFECALYSDLRAAFDPVVQTVAMDSPTADADMRAMMNRSSREGWQALASFLYKAYKQRDRIINNQ